MGSRFGGMGSKSASWREPRGLCKSNGGPPEGMTSPSEMRPPHWSPRYGTCAGLDRVEHSHACNWRLAWPGWVDGEWFATFVTLWRQPRGCLGERPIPKARIRFETTCPDDKQARLYSKIPFLFDALEDLSTTDAGGLVDGSIHMLPECTLASGIWHLASGIWRLASGVWHRKLYGTRTQRFTSRRAETRHSDARLRGPAATWQSLAAPTRPERA